MSFMNGLNAPYFHRLCSFPASCGLSHNKKSDGPGMGAALTLTSLQQICNAIALGRQPTSHRELVSDLLGTELQGEMGFQMQDSSKVLSALVLYNKLIKLGK